MLDWVAMLTTVRILSDTGPTRVELAHWNDQLVVVKRLQSFNPMVRQRLEREAQVVSRLKHPNIVPLLAVQDGALIYDYCPGVNLAQALEAGPLPVNRSVKILRDVLVALDYAHDEGVIHFDVKPGNILIKGERALLTDFGFAKDLALTAITGQQTTLGTPNYMSPEQFQGDRTEARSDLYAAGAVLYHMLTGAPPYGKQVFRVLTGDNRVPLAPLPPPAAELQRVIEVALRLDPAQRFPSARAMLDALPTAARVA